MAASDPLGPLRQALDGDPGNHRLRLVYAEALAKASRFDEAASQYETLRTNDALEPAEMLAAGDAALRAGNVVLASSFADAAWAAGVVQGVAELRGRIDRTLGIEGEIRIVNDPGDGEGLAFELERGVPSTTFAQVGGLDEVKKAINRTIILPLQRPDLYERYGRRAGGGVLLHGPPGCGKTLLARATAGECGLPFLNIRIEDILDPYFGISERNLHEAFATARIASPCVLFIDEIDAIGFARRKISSNVGRPLVDQLLQELDAIGADNEGILILAATNAPWDVDEALTRPGRFDRSFFVPPPDEASRKVILEIALSGRPAVDVDYSALARQTALFSGADLSALVERATDLAIDEALDTGADVPISGRQIARALQGLRSTTVDWIATASRYVEFSNQTGRYDDVRDYLKSKEAKNWRS
jgi:transitional endoplasmic reticulum ATPase